MDYLERWNEIRETYFREAPGLIGRFGGDSLAPLFKEVDEKIEEGTGDELADVEERMRAQLHTLEPILLDLLVEASDAEKAALFQVRDSALALREEFTHFVHMRRTHEEMGVEPDEVSIDAAAESADAAEPQ